MISSHRCSRGAAALGLVRRNRDGAVDLSLFLQCNQCNQGIEPALPDHRLPAGVLVLS